MTSSPDEASDLLAGLLEDAGEEGYELEWSTPDDLARLSVEAMIESQRGDVREAASRGRLRVHGAGVEGHSAPLGLIGQIAARWQGAVSAVGASLEGAKINRGRLSDAIMQRTTLMLATTPAPGSVILNLTPRSDPFAEVAPGGQRSLIETESERALADRANEALIGLLSEAASAGPDAEDLAEHLRELGARVASNVKELAKSLNAANFDLDATWLEPGHPTARATVSASRAGWLAGFVDGQALDSYEDELIGAAHTLSDGARWRVDTEDGPKYVDVSSLPPEAFEVPHLRQTIRLRVLVQPTVRPDGTSTETYTAIELFELE